jgi:hypothetical protein
MVRLSRNPGDEHEFWDLGRSSFEEFALALHASDLQVFNANMYAPDGQAQFGADHYAYRRVDGQAVLEVGQSKAEREFGAAKIRKAADKFLGHWVDQWQPKKVRRFILIVGCKIKSGKAAEEIIAQTERFAEMGVEFELWDATGIYHRLGGAPNAVRTYLDNDWYEKIFGTSGGPLTALARDLARNDHGAQQVVAVVGRLNEAETTQIAEWKRRVRRGEANAVEREVDRALAASSADLYGEDTRARLLRLQAALRVNDGDAERARTLLDQADALDGETSPRLRAIIAMRVVGPAAFLAEPQDLRDPDVAEVVAIGWLRSSKPSEALGALEMALAHDTPSSETFRIAALAQLVAGARDEAVVLARKAVARDSDSRLAAQTLATTLFSRALSPAAEIEAADWPAPIDQPLVLASDDARSDLEEADTIFARLASDPSLENHREIECWSFATLLCMPWRRQMALDRLAALQARKRLSAPILAWCMSRGVDFDREQAIATLARERTAAPDDLQIPLIEVALRVHIGDLARARSVLDATRDALSTAGHGDLCLYWTSILAMEAGKQPVPEAAARFPWLALRAALATKGRKQRLSRIQKIASNLADGGDPRVLLSAVQLLIDGHWHNSAAKFARVLIDRIGTAEAIGMAAHALFRSRRYRDVLDATERGDAYPQGELPDDLKRLRIASLAAIGNLPQATADLTALAAASRRPSDIWSSIEHQLAIGAVPEARAFYEQNADVLTQPTPGHIYLANAMLHSDPTLATQITRDLARNAPDDLVTSAYELANKLRLRDAQRMLFVRIQQLAASGAGGVETVAGIDELLERIRKRRDIVDEAYSHYRAGHLPVHKLAEINPAAVVECYLGPLLDPSAGLADPPSLFARYGRLFDDDVWPGNRRSVTLAIDVTALLTAHGLGMLDVVERAFGTLLIAPDALNCLTQLRAKLQPAQPDRVEAAAAVLALFEGGTIGTTNKSNPGLSVVWALDDEDPSITMNVPRLIESLDTAIADKERVVAIRDALGETARPAAAGIAPARDAVLELPTGIAIELQLAGALDPLREHFALRCASDEITGLRTARAEAERHNRLFASMSDLIARIADGIRDKVYHFAPLDTKPHSDLMARQFFQILGAMEPRGPILWIDDRFASHIDQAAFPVVTTSEVLDALHRFGRMDEKAVFAARQRLRDARWQFLPVTAAEIVFHLKRAGLPGRIIETAQLARLRQAVARAALQRRQLQWPNPAQAAAGARGEVPYLLSSGRQVTDALSTIWMDQTIHKDQAALASDWIIAHLDLELVPPSHLSASDPASDVFVGLHLAQLLTAGILFPPAQKERQDAYLRWVWEHVLDTRLRHRPELYPPIIDFLEHTVVRDPASDVREQGQWRRLTGLFINGLPLPLRARLVDRQAVRNEFGISYVGQIEVGGYSFDAPTFFGAITVATSAKPVFLVTVDQKAVQMSLATDADGSQPILSVDGKEFPLDDWPRRVGAADPAIRRGALDEQASLLDLGAAGLEALNASLGALPDAATRALVVSKQAADTMQGWYQALWTQVTQGRSFRIADLMPDTLQPAFDRLRLPTPDHTLESAAARLLADHGLQEAIRRLAPVPLSIPTCLRDAVAALGDDAAEKMAKDLLAGAMPWTISFAVRLFWERSAGRSPFRKALGQAALAAASGKAHQARWELLLQCARFVAGEAPQCPGWAERGVTQRLVFTWSHAGSLAATFAGADLVKPSLIAFVTKARLISPRQLVADRTGFAGDTANPSEVAVDRIILQGLGPALADMALAETGSRIRDLLGRLLFDAADEGAVPAGAILQAGLAPYDALGSFLAGDLFPVLEPVFGAMLFQHGERLRMFVRAMLADHGQTSRFRAAWTHLRNLSGAGQLVADIAAFARPHVDALDLADIADGVDAARHVLLSLAFLAAGNGWTDLAERIDAAFGLLGPDLSSDRPEDLAILFEIAFARASMEGTSIGRVEILARDMLWLSTFEPLRIPVMIASDRLASALSGADAQPFVDLAARLRLVDHIPV